MPPRKRPAAAAAAAAATAVVRARREPEAITEQTVTKTGKVNVRELGWTPHCKRPVVMGRNLEAVSGARASRRPSKLARKEGKKSITEVAWADSYDPPSDWEGDEDMPQERYESDCRWYAGPAARDLPPFLGPTPGPTDKSLTALSVPHEFVRTQLTGEFLAKCMEYTIAHANQWRDAHPTSRSSTIERSMRGYESRVTAEFVWMWLAVRTRIACLKPEVPAQCLWQRKSHLFDSQVHASMTYVQFTWMNRHCSFAHTPPPSKPANTTVDESSDDDSSDDDSDTCADVCSDLEDEEECDEAEESPARADTHRKRRELTDLLCKGFGRAWHPHQHLGMDEGVRSHKHGGKMRIRFKATVHSGNLVDSLNDCVSKYCLWFEEQHWLHKDAEQDPNSLLERTGRAVECLMDTGSHASPPWALSTSSTHNISSLLASQVPASRAPTTASVSTVAMATLQHRRGWLRRACIPTQ